jgi:hypothetical protein
MNGLFLDGLSQDRREVWPELHTGIDGDVSNLPGIQ